MFEDSSNKTTKVSKHSIIPYKWRGTAVWAVEKDPVLHWCDMVFVQFDTMKIFEEQGSLFIKWIRSTLEE